MPNDGLRKEELEKKEQELARLKEVIDSIKQSINETGNTSGFSSSTF